ncbi:MAG: tetraacyldisaccharide 4'-kinase [Bacteroidota bacterium]
MSILGIILSPLGLIWGIIAQVKRWIYDFAGLRQTATLPNIVVGNLSVGGSGKTPTLMWLHSQLLLLGQSPKNIGILSRGYNRKTTGFRWVTNQSTADEIGDEPLEIATAIQAQANTMAVCENRVTGIQTMHRESPSLSMVLLDDGFQHLRLNPTLSILVCDYHKLFTRDWPMPAGRLREFPWAARNANAVLISNCPNTLNPTELLHTKESLLRSMKTWMTLSPTTQKNVAWEQHMGFLSTQTTPPTSPFDTSKTLSTEPLFLVTGIANPQRVLNNLKNDQVVKHHALPDHHRFNQDSVMKITAEFLKIQQTHPNLAVVTTRKDWVKLQYLWPNNVPIFVVSSAVTSLVETQIMIQTLLKQFIHENHIA